MVPNPQLEDGFTPIANEIMEALAKTNLSAYEQRVLAALLRKTYGYHQKTDRISLTQFQEITGLPRQHVGNALKRLTSRQIITKNNTNYIIEYGLQKDYSLWQTSTPLRTSTYSRTSTPISTSTPIGTRVVHESVPVVVHQSVPEVVHESVPTKESKNTIKYTIQNISSNNETFLEFLISFKEEFNNVDVEEEFKKWKLYWYEGDKKEPKNIKLSFRNWLINARKYKEQNRDNGHKEPVKGISKDWSAEQKAFGTGYRVGKEHTADEYRASLNHIE